ncbi:MAG: binding-protein-dependent transport system inner rane component [Herbinix sp.]|jgi:multiple sugar transport system permease protein|nr:binding-protein-dependent transport system inner rane component [Herbinix sp.]
MKKERNKEVKVKGVSYAKWGYLFLIPFFTVYIIFSLIPLISTFYNSFFENYRSGLKQIGPNFIGLENYKSILNADLLQYISNTFIMWLMGFIPQIVIALLLAVWFSDLRLRLRATGLFKTIIYMPNLIMAAAFSMLFFSLFSDSGPINNILMNMGILKEPFRFFTSVWATRGLIAGMNYLMWFGNTTIVLMAAILGIDGCLLEAAAIDGASPWKVFTKVTIPSIRPILIFVVITSMLGGIQMFDIPQILTNGDGTPNRQSMTLIMFLNNHLFSKNYGMAGALSVILFIISSILSVLVFSSMTRDMSKKKGGR